MTNAAQQPQAQYHYVQGGIKQFADRPPPPGVAYDKVVNGKVVERYVLSNGVLARVLTKEQQAAADARSATQARNAASAAATKKANDEIGAAHAKHVQAREALGTAGQELNRSMDAFWTELQRVNKGLGYQDMAQDAIDYGLAAAGVAAVVAGAVATAPVSVTVVVIGAASTAVGAVNAYMRPETEDSLGLGGAGWDDVAGTFGGSVGVVADLAEKAGTASRFAPSLGVIGAGAGVYSAVNNTSRNLRVPSWDAQGLGQFKGELANFKPTLFEKGGLKWEGVKLEDLEKLRAETEAARKKFDEALAADRAAAEAYVQTVVTWIEPKG